MGAVRPVIPIGRPQSAGIINRDLVLKQDGHIPKLGQGHILQVGWGTAVHIRVNGYGLDGVIVPGGQSAVLQLRRRPFVGIEKLEAVLGIQVDLVTGQQKIILNVKISPGGGAVGGAAGCQMEKIVAGCQRAPFEGQLPAGREYQFDSQSGLDGIVRFQAAVEQLESVPGPGRYRLAGS